MERMTDAEIEAQRKAIIAAAEARGTVTHTARLFGTALNTYYNIAIVLNRFFDQASAFQALDSALEFERGRVETNRNIDNPKVWINTDDEALLRRLIVAEVKSQLAALSANIKKYYPRHNDMDRTGAAVLFLEQWENIGNTMKPTPQTGKKGRNTRPFKDCMIDDSDGGKLKKLHKLMADKKGKSAALIMYGAINSGWITKPTYTQVKSEFGDIGAPSGFNKYCNKPELFSKEEKNGVNNLFD